MAQGTEGAGQDAPEPATTPSVRIEDEMVRGGIPAPLTGSRYVERGHKRARTQGARSPGRGDFEKNVP